MAKVSPTQKTYLDRNIDIYKIALFNRVFFGKKGFKYFIGYKYARNLDLYAYYRSDFDETKYMSFLIKDDELLEAYNENWEKLKRLKDI